MGVTISGMTGRGSIRHNNRSFSAANIDKSRTGLNVTFCQEDLKQVYHQVFDEALAAYNAKKKKTRDKIPDYYEHIRQGKLSTPVRFCNFSPNTECKKMAGKSVQPSNNYTCQLKARQV